MSKGRGAGVAVLRFPGNGLHNDRSEVRVEVVDDSCRVNRFGVGDGVQDLDNRFTVVRLLTGSHFVQNDSQAVNIGRRTDRLRVTG